MEILRRLGIVGERRPSRREQEEQERSDALQKLFREYDAGKIKPETAEEIRYQALRGLEVSGDGWKAAEEALKIASGQ